MTHHTRNKPAHAQPRWLNLADCQVADLAEVLNAATDAEHCPYAADIQSHVPIYDCTGLRNTAQNTESGHAFKRELMAEWAWVWEEGPGILVLKGAFSDIALLDAVTAQFQTLIEQERISGAGGDHFAKPGANDRIWNALQKLCLCAPDLFAHYYANEMLAWVCEAWLGPGYQITSQVNNVRPGGAAQMSHRDYHLGFLTPEKATAYPCHVHTLSPALTLQGAVAHVDMPVESGPTLYLPHSQKYVPGYLLAGRPDFQAYFDAHHVQLPLQKGDAVFFNPALLHAAGHNRTSHIMRMANLLQVSSAFGRAMESVDRVQMSLALFPVLQKMLAQQRIGETEMRHVIAACAEGYAFPTNLDRDPPLGGLAPKSQQDLMTSALLQQWSQAEFEGAVHAQAHQKMT
jgi:ectoine hydroxylase-related dioxygenase (phytanoyl-CoA dioxygenase family)